MVTVTLTDSAAYHLVGAALGAVMTIGRAVGEAEIAARGHYQEAAEELLSQLAQAGSDIPERVAYGVATFQASRA